jgi:hypothetical protein
MKEVRIGHNKNERPIFGKTNPIRAEEGSIIDWGGDDFPEGRPEQARRCRLLTTCRSRAVPRRRGKSLETNMDMRFDNVSDNLSRLFSTPSLMKGEDPDVYAELYGRVDAALDLNRELEEFDRTKDRSVLIKALRDQFLITRYDSATLVEKCKLAALEILIGRMSKMSDNMLIKTMETLYRIGAMDITSITGSGQVKR